METLRTFCRCIGISIMFLAFVGPVSSVASQEVENEVKNAAFEQFKAAQEPLERIACEITLRTLISNVPGYESTRALTIYSDGTDRYECMGDHTCVDPLEYSRPHESIHFLWKGEPFVDACVEMRPDVSGRTQLWVWEEGMERAEQIRGAPDFGGAFLGYFSGFSRKRIVELLEEGLIQTSEEIIQGQQLVKFVGETTEGKVSVWVSPSHGFSIRRILLHKTATDNVDDQGQPYHLAWPLDGETRSVKTLELEVLNTSFTKVDGVVVPSAYQETVTFDLGEGKSIVHTHTAEVKNVRISPNFERLHAFIFYPDSTTDLAIVKPDRELLTGFQWHDGKIVSTAGQDAAQLPPIKIVSLSPKDEAAGLDLPEDSMGQTDSVTPKEIAMVAGIAAIILCCLLISRLLFRRRLGKRQSEL